MIEINLLPKDYLKQTRNLAFGKTGIYAAAGAVVIVGLLVMVTLYQMRQISSLDSNIAKANERAAMLQRDIKLVDGLLDVKNKIGSRMEAVEKLDRHRSVWVRLLSEVASTVPDFVWLKEIRPKEMKAAPAVAAAQPSEKKPAQPGDKVAPPQAAPDTLPQFTMAEIEGHAFTLNALAAFMINLMQSEYFDQVELVSTQETKFADDEKAYNFVVSCNIHYLSEDELRNLVAQAGDTENYNEADFEEAVPPPATTAPTTGSQE